MHVSAVFTGTADERGYRKGQRYDLVIREVKSLFGGSNITITPSVLESPGTPSGHLYKGLEALFGEWTELKVK